MSPKRSSFPQSQISRFTSFPCEAEPTERAPRTEETELEERVRHSWARSGLPTRPRSHPLSPPAWPRPAAHSQLAAPCTRRESFLSSCCMAGWHPLLGMPPLPLPMCQGPVPVVLSGALALTPPHVEPSALPSELASRRLLVGGSSAICVRGHVAMA